MYFLTVYRKNTHIFNTGLNFWSATFQLWCLDVVMVVALSVYYKLVSYWIQTTTCTGTAFLCNLVHFLMSASTIWQLSYIISVHQLTLLIINHYVWSILCSKSRLWKNVKHGALCIVKWMNEARPWCKEVASMIFSVQVTRGIPTLIKQSTINIHLH